MRPVKVVIVGEPPSTTVDVANEMAVGLEKYTVPAPALLPGRLSALLESTTRPVAYTKSLTVVPVGIPGPRTTLPMSIDEKPNVAPGLAAEIFVESVTEV